LSLLFQFSYKYIIYIVYKYGIYSILNKISFIFAKKVFDYFKFKYYQLILNLFKLDIFMK